MNCAPKLGRFILYGSRYAASCRASSPLTRGKRDRRRGGSHRWGLIPTHAGKTVPQGPRRSVSRAHPHSREENYAGASDVLRRNGSSPLTRGKPLAVPLVALAPRLIPAHAGKTTRAPRSPAPRRAHPRSRRENKQRLVAAASQRGSSPLTPGKLVRFAPGKVHQGLIPAHAGKTSPIRTRQSPSGAHPRSRRENKQLLVAAASQRGSSPLTRGKPRRRCPLGDADGLIPAHAGKTRAARRMGLHHRAHPRSRGENTVSTSAPRALSGSSPLTRGKPNVGLIAAVSAVAHPRSRGENNNLDGAAEVTPGSSPLTRGKRSSARPGNASGGLIPAHAGKTSARFSSEVDRWAHPRSRGENTEDGILLYERWGSSPLTRGKRSRRRLDNLHGGLIPAHAGKTVPMEASAAFTRAHPRSRGENTTKVSTS